MIHWRVTERCPAPETLAKSRPLAALPHNVPVNWEHPADDPDWDEIYRSTGVNKPTREVLRGTLVIIDPDDKPIANLLINHLRLRADPGLSNIEGINPYDLRESDLLGAIDATKFLIGRMHEQAKSPNAANWQFTFESISKMPLPEMRKNILSKFGLSDDDAGDAVAGAIVKSATRIYAIESYLRQ